MDKGVDSGDVLFESRFKIPKNIWVDELYNITYKKSLILLKKSIKDIFSLNFTPKPQKKLEKKEELVFIIKMKLINLKKLIYLGVKKRLKNILEQHPKKILSHLLH